MGLEGAVTTEELAPQYTHAEGNGYQFGSLSLLHKYKTAHSPQLGIKVLPRVLLTLGWLIHNGGWLRSQLCWCLCEQR